MIELSFQLPEASIAVEATEAQRLFEELERLGARPTGQGYARMARRVGTAAHERSAHAVELLDVAENEKVLRALEHLVARDELSPGLVSLWEGLTRDLAAGSRLLPTRARSFRWARGTSRHDQPDGLLLRRRFDTVSSR
jgi:hypothetical protein